MLLTSELQQEKISWLIHLSCGGRPLDKYLRALSLDSLRPFDTRAAILFGLEEDLTINPLESFGILQSELEEIGPLHLLQDSAFSKCLTASSFTQTGSGAAGLLVPEANHMVFLPLPIRGAPYAGMAVWTVEDPRVEEQSQFWEAVGLATGLALTCHWMPASLSPKTESPQSVELTPRQFAILHLVAQGLTNREIARRLNYGLSTIGHELMAIFKALGVDSRSAATREAGRLGLLSTSAHPAEAVTRLVS